jgi:hypothetical protein
MMIPSSVIFDQSTLTALLEHDPVVQQYRAFFSLLDWSVVEQWQERRSVYCDTHGHPITAYLKAFLIRIGQGMLYMTRLRSFLLAHPLLIIELRFQLHLDPTTPYGFDPEKTLPCRFWFSQKLRTLDPALLQALLHATVRDLKEEIPGLGEVVAFDVKHIYAWVKENNERAYVPDRYDKSKTLVGDPDCTLGVKRSTNQEQADGSTKEKDVNWEPGGLMRVQLDRSGPLYQAISTQRTSCERINSQAKEPGIERPKVRNRRSVANLNTLIYVVINARALRRAKSTNRGLLPMS